MIPFGAWLPDIATFESAAASEALNVIPSLTGYKPFPAFVSVADALTARARGGTSVRSTTGTIYNFAGDATKLYYMDADGMGWSDVSRLAGGAYTTAADQWWKFTVFGNYCIATNLADAVQMYELGTSTDFAALSGSPPKAAFCGNIRDFAVLAKCDGAFNRVKWSAFNDVKDWVTSATTMSDSQDLPDGGLITGFVGGEYGIVFQERAITRMSFEGPPTIFRFDKVSQTLGCRVEGSIAAFDNKTFFLADDGFYMLYAGADPVPIGSDKVNDWIESNLDSNYLYRVTSAIDPLRQLYIMSFPGGSASSGTPDSLIMYHWPTGKWSRAMAEHEIIYTAMTQASYTIDGMDAISSTIDALPFPMDSRFWTGSGRLLLSSFNTSHQFGYFSGNSLEAKLETGDAQLTPGRKSMLRQVRPMIEGTSVTPSLVIKYRDRLQDAHTSSAGVSANANGICPVRVNARYHRAQITIPATSYWKYATGVHDLKFSAMGAR